MAEKVLLKRKNSNQDLLPVTSMECITDFPHKDRIAGNVLAATTDGYQWIDVLRDMNFDRYAYGVQWTPNVADPTLTRIGRSELHKTLPIQSKMKVCIYKPKTGEVSYWIDDTRPFAKKGCKPEEFPTVDLVRFTGTVDSDGNPELSTDISTLTEGDTIINTTDFPPEVFNDIFVGKEVYVYAGTNDITDRLPFLRCKVSNFNVDSGKIQFKIVNIMILYPGTDIPVSSNSKRGTIDFDPVKFDGYDGEVMVYIPEFWIKSWDTDTERKVMISEVQIDDTWEHQPAIYIGAYKDTILNRVPENMGYLTTLEVNSAVSIANDSDYCRGGGNRANLDTQVDKFKRDLGKHRTNQTRGMFRSWARKSGKEILSYRQYKNILYWLWVIEYATFNSQAPYNPELTSEGYHQGGMGYGITNVQNWSDFNGLYSVCSNGYTNVFGNGTGIIRIDSTELLPLNSVYAIRWRGIENPFGDSWNNVDGVIVHSASIDKDGAKWSAVYTTDNPEFYNDSTYLSMDKSGDQCSGGWIKEFALGSTAEIIPRSVGGNVSSYKCDNSWVISTQQLSTLILGGHADNGGAAGLGAFRSDNGVGGSGASVGFRTSCIAK